MPSGWICVWGFADCSPLPVSIMYFLSLLGNSIVLSFPFIAGNPFLFLVLSTKDPLVVPSFFLSVRGFLLSGTNLVLRFTLDLYVS